MYLFNGERPPGGGGAGTAMAGSSPQIRRFIILGLVVVALILIFVFLSQARGFYTDWLWFSSLGFRSVFSKILVLQIWLFFAGAFTFLAMLLPNIYVAYRFSKGASILPVTQDVFGLIRLGAIVAVVVTAVVMSIVFGAVASGRWETFLLFFNKVSFGIEDPQYNMDISFYVSVLPLLHFIQGWLMGGVITIIVAMVAFYVMMYTIRGMKFQLTSRMRAHFAVLGALLMVTIAMAHYLDTYEPLFSGSGAVYGATYADVHGRILALRIITGVALLSAVGFIASIYFGGLRFMIASFGLWALFAVVVGAIYPALVQRFSVDPDEFNKEEPYIQRNLEATRAAYNLENIQVQTFPYRSNVSPDDLAQNQETIDNIRLWDPIPLTANYNREQFFELYYDFLSVDVDRYTIDGEYRQVMLSARELSPEGLPQEAQRWVNRKLQYTHGYGVVMSPVTSYTREGTPEFLLRDIPPRGVIPLDNPQIYFGENTTDFVIVNTKTQEFDYPGPGGQAVQTTYEGDGGVPIGSFIRKLAYAWQFLDINLLISNQLTSESKVMYRRTIPERVREVAPFLTMDSDPYLVVADGKLWWIQDAFTTTDRYPYATPTGERFNYIRNSVKVVVDAYNGTMKFYVVDPDDPVVRMYQRAFPDLFEPVTQPDPFEAIPEGLRSHMRYPLDLFMIQARRNLQYHMRSPEEFFRKDKQWAFANELFFDEPQEMKPYYVNMTLPGESRSEFVLILPFTPFEKKTMVSWMAARNDPPHYGELLTFGFPGDIPGPELVEARITNDDTIRRELTLLCPEARVVCIRGNLLVVPLTSDDGREGSVLYVEPLFIRPQGEDFPPLKKVFVADRNTVVMADTLQSGLKALVAVEAGDQVGEEPPVVVSPGPSTGGPVLTPEATEQLRQAIEEIRRALAQLEQQLEGLTQPEEGGETQ